MQLSVIERPTMEDAISTKPLRLTITYAQLNKPQTIVLIDVGQSPRETPRACSLYMGKQPTTAPASTVTYTMANVLILDQVKCKSIRRMRCTTAKVNLTLSWWYCCLPLITKMIL